MTLGETLLVPTKIYVKALRTIKESGVRIKACSHITGGGFYENIPRMLKEGTHAKIEKNSFVIPPIFRMLANDGNVSEESMFNTYNMGVGMIIAVAKEDVQVFIHRDIFFCRNTKQFTHAPVSFVPVGSSSVAHLFDIELKGAVPVVVKLQNLMALLLDATRYILHRLSVV